MKKIVRCIVTLLCVCMMFTVFTACGSNKKTLKIGFTYYEPMNYKDDDNTFVGFDTELAQKFCEKYGYKAKFVEINWDNKIISLNSKEIDIVWNGMTITSELQDAMGLSSPYLTNKQVAVIKKSNQAIYTNQASLENAKVIVEGGSAGEIAATEAGAQNITSAEAQKDTLIEIKSGASDVAIIDYTMAREMIKDGTDYSELMYVEMDFTPEEYAVGVRKNDTELLQKLNDCIEDFKADDTFTNLGAKYNLTDLLVK